MAKKNTTLPTKPEETSAPLPAEQPVQLEPLGVSDQEQQKAYKAAEMTATTIDNLAARLSDFKEAPVIPSMEEVKKKRGRPAGSKKEQRVPVEDFKPKVEQPVFAGAVISGIVLLTIVDAFIPWLIVVFHNKKSVNKIQASDLKLPADVKKELSVAADEAIKASNIKISPSTALFFSLIAAYGTAYMAVSTRKPTKAETQAAQQPNKMVVTK